MEEEPQHKLIADPQQEQQQQQVLRERGWTRVLVLASVVTTVGAAIPIGYTIGVVNAPAQIIQDWIRATSEERYSWTVTESQMNVVWASVVSMFLVGGVTGSLAGSWLADWLGRRGAILILMALELAAAAAFLLTKPAASLELLLAGRLLVGLAAGLTYAVLPMYLTELSPPSLQGALGVLCPLGVNLGVFLGQVMGLPELLGTEATWPELLGAYAALTLAAGLGLPWLPESHKFLYTVKRDKRAALRVLSRIRDLPEDWVVGELELNPSSSTEDEEGWSVRRLLSTPSLYLPLALVCSLQAGQQLSGINAVFYYSVSIFKSAGLTDSEAAYANLGAGGLNFLTALVMVPTVNVLPRRLMTLLSCSGSCLALAGLTAALALQASVPWLSFMAVAFTLLYVLAYGIGLGPIAFFLGSELFEVGPRPAAMAIGSMSNWAGNLLVGMAFPSVNNAIGYYSFLFFVAVTAALTIFHKLYLPETNPRVLSRRQAQTPAEP